MQLQQKSIIYSRSLHLAQVAIHECLQVDLGSKLKTK